AAAHVRGSVGVLGLPRPDAGPSRLHLAPASLVDRSRGLCRSGAVEPLVHAGAAVRAWSDAPHAIGSRRTLSARVRAGPRWRAGDMARGLRRRDVDERP